MKRVVIIFSIFTLLLQCDKVSVYDEGDYDASGKGLLEVIVVNNTEKTLPADNISRTQIRVVAPSSWESATKVAVIKTTGGTLTDGPNSSEKSINTTFVQDTASFFLVSGQIVETVRIDISLEGFSSISETLLFNFTPVDSETYLRIEGGSLTGPADGLSESEILLIAQGSWSSVNKTVELKTTLGSFSKTGIKTTETFTFINDTARSILYSSNTPGEAVLTAKIVQHPNIIRDFEFVFNPVEVDDYFTVFHETTNTSFQGVADGFSRNTLLFIANESLNSTGKSLSVETTLGSFSSTSVNRNQTFPFINDTARVVMFSSKDTGEALLTATLVQASHIKKVVAFNFLPSTEDDILRFETPLANTQFEADGESQIEIVLQQHPDVPNDNNSVTLSTTHGSFPGNNNGKEIVLTPDQNGELRTFMTVHSSNTNARLTAKNDKVGIIRALGIEFIQAGPDVINISTSTGQLITKSDSLFTFDVNVIRDLGKVTEGVLLSASAIDTTGNIIGRFNQQFFEVSTSNETINMTYYPSGTSYSGMVQLVVSNNANGIIGQIELEIVK